jgi:hypothetical protein
MFREEKGPRNMFVVRGLHSDGLSFEPSPLWPTFRLAYKVQLRTSLSKQLVNGDRILLQSEECRPSEYSFNL